MVVGNRQLRGLINASTVLGAGRLEDGDDALHAFDKITYLGRSQALTGCYRAESEFSCLPTVFRLGDPERPTLWAWLLVRSGTNQLVTVWMRSSSLRSVGVPMVRGRWGMVRAIVVRSSRSVSSMRVRLWSLAASITSHSASAA